jgi:hypothetical protein
MSEANETKLDLSDEQITTLLDVCTEVSRIIQEIPKPPAGFSMDPEVRAVTSRQLRASVEKKSPQLLSLGMMLRSAASKARTEAIMKSICDMDASVRRTDEMTLRNIVDASGSAPMSPVYYVRHSDDTYSEADPQPTLLTAE